MNDVDTTSPPELVSLKRIVRDPRFQVRLRLDKGIVSRYMTIYAGGGEMGPVQLVRVEKKLYLVDGWHRVKALEQLGMTRVAAVIVEGTMRDALWLAACANLTHGLPLKKSELRRVFQGYIRARRYRDENGGLKSYRAIAKELHSLVAYTTVRNWLYEDFPKIARQYAADPDEDPEAERGDGRQQYIEIYEDAVNDAFRAALASFKAITDNPSLRGKLIGNAERMLEEMKAAGPWQPYHEPPGPFALTPEEREKYDKAPVRRVSDRPSVQNEQE